MPKRKPSYVHAAQAKDDKPPAKPKKWNAFSINDSRSIEATFQKLSDQEDREEQSGSHELQDVSGDVSLSGTSATDGVNRSLEAAGDLQVQSVKVAVNEDYLFDVDVGERELGPAYWLGPIYEVRRGTWFDGSTLMPVDENLAVQLEEGFLKTKPWRFVPTEQLSTTNKNTPSETPEATPSSATASRSESVKFKQSVAAHHATGKSRSISVSSAKNDAVSPSAPPAQQPVLTHRLFGAYMNQVATYQGTSAAWVLSDDFLSKVSGAMFQRFVGGAGTKYIRGYNEVAKKKTPKETKRPTTPTQEDGKGGSQNKRSRSVPASRNDEKDEMAMDNNPVGGPGPDPNSRVATLERQMSNLVSASAPTDPEKQDEEERKREEMEIQDDYRDTSGESQDREVDHLILVTHGIGQRLGARFDSFNFIHDVNEFRRTLKAVYGASPDLQALNGEVEKHQKNCRIQVLPICWRHLLDFPQQGIKYNRQEHDIADVNEDEDEYPSLESITVEGVPALRSILSDLALDVLLYQTPAYKDHISKIVVRECNRILKLFKRRNPGFDGKVSLIGHSLGSAIMFDALADQASDQSALERVTRPQHAQTTGLKLNFDVDSFFCFGSPIGLFQMLKGQKIAGRTNPNQVTLDGFPDSLDDPFSESSYTKLPAHTISDAQRDALVSSPKCRQLYNIFHPTDPIGYRLEPLISPAMSSLKPQMLPYTKKNFFGAPMGQGFTGIPAKVGQSFTGFWSNFSSGLANSFINRSLGLSAEDAAKLGAPTSTPTAQTQALAQAQTQIQVQRERAKSQSLGAGTNIVGGGVIPNQEVRIEKTVSDSGRPGVTQEDPLPTLIDQEMETLYSGFEKTRKTAQESDTATRDFGESPLWIQAEERGRKLRREEAKVRALNSNGRVDYSIQE